MRNAELQRPHEQSAGQHEAQSNSTELACARIGNRPLVHRIPALTYRALEFRSVDFSSVRFVQDPIRWSSASTPEGTIANSIKRRVADALTERFAVSGPGKFHFDDLRFQSHKYQVPVDALLHRQGRPSVILEIVVSDGTGIRKTFGLQNGLLLARHSRPDTYGCRLIVDCAYYSNTRSAFRSLQVDQMFRRIAEPPRSRDNINVVAVDARALNSYLQTTGVSAAFTFKAFAAMLRLFGEPPASLS